MSAPESHVTASAPDSAGEPRQAVSGDLRGPEGPAERLRLAADRLERTAVAATPGPWVSERATWAHENVRGHVAAPKLVSETREGVAHATEADADWIALASPALAPPLVAWLRSMAIPWHEYLGEVPNTPRAHALALADVILGGGR